MQQFLQSHEVPTPDQAIREVPNDELASVWGGMGTYSSSVIWGNGVIAGDSRSIVWGSQKSIVWGN